MDQCVPPCLKKAETFEACELPSAQSPSPIVAPHTSAQQSKLSWIQSVSEITPRIRNNQRKKLKSHLKNCDAIDHDLEASLACEGGVHQE